MGRQERILIYDTCNFFSAYIFKKLKNTEFDVSFQLRSEIFSVDEVIKNNPDIIVFTITSITKEIPEFLSELKSRCPEIKIVAVSFIHPSNPYNEIIRSIADQYVNTPDSAQSIYSAIIKIYGCRKTFEFERNVAKHLKLNGIDANMTDFRYFITAICYALVRPELTSCMKKELYVKIAEAYGTTVSAIDNAIQRISKSLYGSGKYKAFLGEQTVLDKRLTNYELICAVASDIAVKYKI